MKRRLVTIILFALSLWSTLLASDWQKFVAKDKSFSFHYPKGWQVKEEPSVVEVKNPAADEELLIVAAPFDAAKTPRQLAEDLVGIFRSLGVPDMQASGWTSSPDSKDKAVHFRVKYTDEGKKYDSNVMFLKGDAQAVWFSFSAPLEGYDASRALGVLEKVVASVAEGSASLPPDSTAPSARPPQAAVTNTDKNAKAFLFVLEFALGAPLTVSQERVILAELKDGWKNESPEELRKYDQYPTLVQVILRANQSQLESVRAELEKAVREWIEDYRGKSDSVTIIESELKRKGKVVVAGDPPLTEMAASAYSEIMAYSELLQTNSGAQPEEIDQTTVQDIREQLKREWLQFSRSDRELIGTSPGLWICQRAILGNGSAADQEQTRAQIRRLSGASQGPATGQLSASDREMSRKLANDMIKHNVLMNIQQQTFNTYMWSRGFNYHPVYGKMW